MRINFRQGIISKQTNFLQLNGSGNIDLVTNNRPVTLSVAHKDTDYQFSEPITVIDAWKGIFDPNTTYWLYWNFDLLTLERTFGSTTLQPLTQSSEPTSGTDSDGQAILQPGRMWFDTVNFINHVYQGTSFKPVLRVFAGIVTGGNTISTASINTNFTGTQIGVTTSTFAGRPIFDDSGNPVQKSNGTFFTTESSFFSGASRIDTIRLESNSVRAQSTESNIAKFTAVAWTGSGRIKSAEYDDTGNTVVGILLEDTALDQIGSVIVQGTVTNPNWNWSNIGQKLWIDNDGTLTETDPHVSNVSANPQKKVPVARVLSSDTIIFEQGLGGVGPTGPTGSIENLPAATTSDLGAVRLTTQPSNTQSPLAVSDNDSRLTDARPPTSHTHSASDITLTPVGDISANDIQNAIGELDDEKVAKSGDTMSGFLVLSADPTNNLHATTKRYVDGLVSGLVWKEPISVLNMIADDITSPPSSPVEGDTYLMPSGTTGAWSSYDENDVVSWDGSSWVNRGQIANLASEPRIGVAFDTPTTPSGSFNGRKNQIAAYGQTNSIQNFITPTKNDAVFVRSASDQFAFFQYAYDGTSWVQFGGLQVAESLDDIDDVDAPSPSDGQALIYDSSSGNWIPGAGGVETLNQLDDVNASSPSDNHILRYIQTSAGTTDNWSYSVSSPNDVAAKNGFAYTTYSSSVTKIDSLGNHVWTFTGFPDFATCVDVDDNNYVYAGGSSFGRQVRKIDSLGNNVWNTSISPSAVNDVRIDPTNTYVYGAATENLTKLDVSNGNIVWDFSVSQTDFNCVDVDTNHIYTGSNGNIVYKIDTAGNQVWTFNGHTSEILAIAVDSTGYVYSGGFGNQIKKIDPVGNEVTSGNWPYTQIGTISNLVVDSNDDLYASSEDNTVYKLDSSGNIIWTYTGHTDEVQGVAVDSNLYVYTASYDDIVRRLEQTQATAEWTDVLLTLSTSNDVDASPTQDNLLRYNGSQWVETDVKVDSNNALYGTNLKQETVTGTSYTITGADSGKLLQFSSSSTIIVTVPEQSTESLPTGFTTAMRQSGAGQIAIATEGSDALNNIDGHNGSEGQHALISIVLEVAGSPNEWILDGRTASVSTGPSGWTDRTSDTYWEVEGDTSDWTWDGSKWIYDSGSTVTNSNLGALGWASGARPTMWRINYTVDSTEFSGGYDLELRDSEGIGGNLIATITLEDSVGTYDSPEVNISYSGFDIGQIQTDGSYYDVLHINSIEFFFD